MSLCVVSGLKTVIHTVSFFTLSWSHSVEKTEWKEVWKIEKDKLVLKEARIKGSGAGMEPPAGSMLIDGWYVYKPNIKPTKEVILSNSDVFLANWKICYDKKCKPIVAEKNKTLKLTVCNSK